MTIQDVKNDPILQVSSQEPSTSSKYDFEDGGVLDTLLFMLECWNLAHKSKITYHDDPLCQEWLHPPSIQSGTFSVLQVWLRGWRVLDTLPSMLESWNLAYKSRNTYHDDPWRQEWPHPPSIQSGTFNVLQVWLSGWGVLDSLLIMLESWNLVHMSRITYDDIHMKNPYISVKLCHNFSKFLGLVSEGPPNCRYIVDGTHLLQLVALFFIE